MMMFVLYTMEEAETKIQNRINQKQALFNICVKSDDIIQAQIQITKS